MKQWIERACLLELRGAATVAHHRSLFAARPALWAALGATPLRAIRLLPAQLASTSGSGGGAAGSSGGAYFGATAGGMSHAMQEALAAALAAASGAHFVSVDEEVFDEVRLLGG